MIESDISCKLIRINLCGAPVWPDCHGKTGMAISFHPNKTMVSTLLQLVG